jgi:hypothetical protein
LADDDVATIVPEVETVLNSNTKVSVPSVARSDNNVLVTVPVLLVIVTLPDVTPSEKSAPVDVPDVVQYNTVPSTIKPVVIVIVIVSPSLYEAARLERLYVATGVALITLKFLEAKFCLENGLIAIT